MSERRAVFLDRDGTLIEDVSYLRDPAQVRLLPGAAEAVGRLNRAGMLAIVVTNQSGIARGLLTLDDYTQAERRVEELLAGDGARLDAQYFCPHLPKPDDQLSDAAAASATDAAADVAQTRSLEAAS